METRAEVVGAIDTGAQFVKNAGIGVVGDTADFAAKTGKSVVSKVTTVHELLCREK
jgi:hypothetical protein